MKRETYRPGRATRSELCPVRVYRSNTVTETGREVLLTPLGELMDQWELHKQFLGIAKPKREVFIEDIIPEGI